MKGFLNKTVTNFRGDIYLQDSSKEGKIKLIESKIDVKIYDEVKSGLIDEKCILLFKNESIYFGALVNG